MSKMLNVVKKVGMKVAKNTVNQASFAFIYQVKEPANLKERLNTQK